MKRNVLFIYIIQEEDIGSRILLTNKASQALKDMEISNEKSEWCEVNGTQLHSKETI